MRLPREIPLCIDDVTEQCSWRTELTADTHAFGIVVQVSTLERIENNQALTRTRYLHPIDDNATKCSIDVERWQIGGKWYWLCHTSFIYMVCFIFCLSPNGQLIILLPATACISSAYLCAKMHNFARPRSALELRVYRWWVSSNDIDQVVQKYAGTNNYIYFMSYDDAKIHSS
jgi:hypothetical protein